MAERAGGWVARSASGPPKAASASNSLRAAPERPAARSASARSQSVRTSVGGAGRRCGARPALPACSSAAASFAGPDEKYGVRSVSRMTGPRTAAPGPSFHSWAGLCARGVSAAGATMSRGDAAGRARASRIAKACVQERATVVEVISRWDPRDEPWHREARRVQFHNRRGGRLHSTHIPPRGPGGGRLLALPAHPPSRVTIRSGGREDTERAARRHRLLGAGRRDAAAPGTHAAVDRVCPAQLLLARLPDRRFPPRRPARERVAPAYHPGRRRPG